LEPIDLTFKMIRSVLATGASFILTSMVFANAYVNRQQFYPSVVYITKSNSSMAVIYLQALVLVMLLGKLMSKVFFGRLRAAEFEHLMERSWYAITETCLAFTVFKDDFSPKFVALFSLLLFLKSFHWLAEDRVDYMERSPSISLLFHIRVVSLAVLLASVDAAFISYAFQSTITKGASVQLVFGFEYAILLTIVVNTVVKYILNSIDLHSENPWEGKAVCLLYAELVLGFIKVLFYLLFIVIMVRIYSLPLFAVRPMYLTLRAFKKAFNDVIMSRRAIHNMNTWYPDATEEELANTDNVCIICREEMSAPTTKKLPCGHIFHKTCLRSWFQRQQTCPTCRLDVLRSPQARARQQAQQQQQQANQGGAAAGAAAPGAANLQAGGVHGGPPPPVPPGVPHVQARLPAIDPAVLAQIMQGFGLPPPPQPPRAPASTAPGTTPTSSASTATPASASTTTTTTTQSSQPAAGSVSSSGAPPAPPPQGLPPMPPPPPSFPFPAGLPTVPPPYGVPPPLPPPNFSGMTDQELRDMEGNERANVEARVKCLRNIQVLLDAAVLEMQQYSGVVARLNRGDVIGRSSATGAGDTAATVKKEVKQEPSSDSASSPTPKPTSETGAIPKSIKKESEDKDAEAEEIIRKMDAKDSEGTRSRLTTVQPSETSEAPASPAGQDNLQDEIRKKRLEKLQQNQNN